MEDCAETCTLSCLHASTQKAPVRQTGIFFQLMANIVPITRQIEKPYCPE